mgnify:FL=1
MSTEYDRTTVPERFVRKYLERRRQRGGKDFPEGVTEAIIYLVTDAHLGSPTSTTVK